MIQTHINKVLAGNTNAFRVIITEYKQMVFAVSMQITRNEHLAEDAAQETFIKAFVNLKKFKGDSKFSTWLYRIAVNEALQLIKQDWFKGRQDLSPRAGGIVSDSTEPLEILKVSDKKRIIEEVLKKLKPKESLIMHLFYLQEQSIAEISAIVNLKSGNVKVILSRARINFYNGLSKQLKNELMESK